jgi:hypothetical protein
MSQNTTLENLKQNCTDAYNKVKAVQEQYDRYKYRMQTKFQFFKDALKTFHQSILYAGGADDD